MQITVTARHCEIPDDLRERALELVDRVARFAHRPQHVEVVFDDDHQRKVVELRMYLPQGKTHIATAEETDFRTALDRALDKLRSQFDGKGGRAPRGAGTG